MTFSLNVLGSNSAIPTLTRNPSAQVLNVNERLFLIDCAEGTQIQFRKFKIRFQRINHIFISHLHGDHYFGLMGLLFSYHLLGREKELYIYAPPDLQKVIDLHIKVAKARLGYTYHFIPLENGIKKRIYEDDSLCIDSFPMKHRIPTWGFVFCEKKGDRKMRKDMMDKLNIPFEAVRKIKKGANYTDENGRVYENTLLTASPPTPRSFAYCSDTKYDESIISHIKGVDLLYHEATFAEDMKETSEKKMHTTARQAAMIAKKAGVKELLIGHFSSRYDSPEILLREAREVFPETIAACDGKRIEVSNT